MGDITIRHIPTGKSTVFAHPRDALSWLARWDDAGMSRDVLDINNQYGVALSAYDPKIPRDGQDLIERVELDFGGNIVPEWHWIKKEKRQRYATGTTRYTVGNQSVKRISISSDNFLDEDYLGVILHEMAHALVGHAESHNRTFYRMLFRLLRKYTNTAVEKWTIAREMMYKKSSRYWYAEMYNIEHILSEYQPRTFVVAANRLTREQKEAQVLGRFFSEAE